MVIEPSLDLIIQTPSLADKNPEMLIGLQELLLNSQPTEGLHAFFIYLASKSLSLQKPLRTQKYSDLILFVVVVSEQLWSSEFWDFQTRVALSRSC